MGGTQEALPISSERKGPAHNLARTKWKRIIFCNPEKNHSEASKKVQTKISKKNLCLIPTGISVIFVFNMILQNFPVKEKVEK